MVPPNSKPNSEKRDSNSERRLSPLASRFSLFATRLSLLLLPLFLAGCKSPFPRTLDASGGGALNAFGSGNFVVFSSELKTGGGAFLYPGGENQTLTFNDTSNPISARSIRYHWNGGDISSDQFGLIHTFAGFDLMHTASQATYSSTVGRDLHLAGYGKATFFMKGTLSDNNYVLKVEVADDGDTGTAAPSVTYSNDGATGDPGSPTCANRVMPSSWSQETITGITPGPAGNLANVKDFFKATFVYLSGGAAGAGGTVYFDAIQYEP
jgi:hypothetical protein